jgi:Conserved hypothetical ATP binding protein
MVPSSAFVTRCCDFSTNICCEYFDVCAFVVFTAIMCMQEQLQPFIESDCYFVIDCPGQAELFMCHDSFKRVVNTITSQWHINLTAVQLVDSHLCTAPHTYLSAMLMCLSSMLQLELPHVNVLSKVHHQSALCSVVMLQLLHSCYAVLDRLIGT